MTPPPTFTPDPKLARQADRIARHYLQSLPLEHFMESTAQSTQRKITDASFDLIRQRRPDVQCFGELLILYPRPRKKRKVGRVVPDNMVVVHPDPLRLDTNLDLRNHPARPLLVMEYVSKGSRRKDYDDNYDIYRLEVGVPYYLLYYPDADELTVFRRADRRYVSVKPNEAGRLAVPELELEVALLDGWVRYWFRGELLPLAGEWTGQMAAVRAEVVAEREARRAAEQAAAAERHRADAERQRADAEATRATAAEAEMVRLREELAQLRGQT